MPRRKLAHYIVPNLGAVLVLVLALTGRIGAQPRAATAQATTTTISYQGHLTNASGQPTNGSLPMVFNLYAAPTGGAAAWTESRSGATAVPVANGLFNVLLGSVTPIDTNLLNQDLWLGISVDGDAEMSPREKLGSVPYAARAGVAQDVADGSITTAKLNVDGNVDMHGWGVHNALRMMAPANADNFDLLYEQNSNLWLKSGATSGAVHIGARGNVPLDMHGNPVLNAGNLLTDPNGATVRYGSAVVDTDGNCRAQINFPTTFSSSLYSLVATNGDFDAASFAVEIRWNTSSGFVAQIRKLDGTGCQNSHIRINYIAIGK